MIYVNRFLVVLQLIALVACVGGALTMVWIATTNNYDMVGLSDRWEVLGFIAFPLAWFLLITGARFVAEGEVKLLPWSK